MGRAEAVHTVGVLGAGRAGTAIARLALRAGYRVLVAGTRHPRDLAPALRVAAPGAEPATASRAAGESDVAVLALPLHRYRGLDAAALRGRVVIDAMNHWPPTDGHLLAGSTSELVRDHLPGARLVKTLNHIAYRDLEADARPPGTPGRRALAVAGDDPGARATVMRLLDRLGYDPVDAGPLAAGTALQPGTAVFDGRHDRAALAALLGRAGDPVGAALSSRAPAGLVPAR